MGLSQSRKKLFHYLKKEKLLSAIINLFKQINRWWETNNKINKLNKTLNKRTPKKVSFPKILIPIVVYLC